MLCAHCGNKPGKTNDHLPPKNLYAPAKRDKLYFVPACRDCQKNTGADDEEFKLILGIDTGEFQDGPSEVLDSIALTTGSNRRLQRQVFSTMARGYAMRGGSMYVPVTRISFQRARYDRVIERIVRGMYWRENGRALGLDTKIVVIPQGLERRCVIPLMRWNHSRARGDLNDNTFSYDYCLFEDGSSVWELTFFGKHTVYALADSPEWNP